MCSRNVNAAVWCLDVVGIAKAMDPLTPGFAPDGPFGIPATAASPTMLEIFLSLRSANVDSQLRIIAVLPPASALLVSSSR